MSRQQRVRNSRRMISLEHLEDRRLLSGNVTAVLNPTTGALAIQGDIGAPLAGGNNSISLFTYTQPGTGLTELRVQGNTLISLPPTLPPTLPDVTTVNGSSFNDFDLSRVTSIGINLGTGNDSVYLGNAKSTPVGPIGPVNSGFAVPGNLTIGFATLGTAGAGNEIVSSTGITANQLNITSTNTSGTSTFGLTNTTAGGSIISAGTGVDKLTLTGGAIGTTVLTTAGNANDTIAVSGFPTPAPGKTGLGQLSITEGNGNNNVSVTGSTLTALQGVGGPTTPGINLGNGNNTVVVGVSPAGPAGPNSVSVVNAANITVGNGNNSVNFNGSSFGSSIVKAGNGVNQISVSNDSITKIGGLSLTNGTGSATGASSINVNSDIVTLGPVSIASGVGGTNLQTVNVNADTIGGALTVNLGDGPVYFSSPPPTALPFSSFTATGHDTVGGAANITLGANFKNVSVGDSSLANELVAPSLNLTIGATADVVSIFTAISGAETISTGAFETFPTPTIPASSFILQGTAGSLNLNVGANAVTATQAAIVTGNETLVFGNNDGAVSAVRPTSSGDSITVGNNVGSVTITGIDNGPASLLPYTETILIGNGITGVISIGGALNNNGTQNVTIGTNDNNAGNVLSTTVGVNQTVGVSDNTTLTVSSNVTGNQNITGTTGDTLAASGTIGGNQTITTPSTGTNDSITDTSPSAANVTIQNLGTNATVVVNGVNVAGGDITVTNGDNAVLVEVAGSTALALTVSGGNGSPANAPNSFYVLYNDTILGDPSSGLGLTFNVLNGNNTVEIVGLSVLDGMFVNGGTGINTFFVQGTAADYGFVNGGTGPANNYYDLGGNSDTWITGGFNGYFPG